MIKEHLKLRFPPGSTIRWLIAEAFHRPITFPLAALKSWLASWKLTKRLWPISVRIHPLASLHLEIHPRADVRLDGLLLAEPWGGIHEESTISVGQDATLHIGGDFLVGPGSHIMIGQGDHFPLAGEIRKVQVASLVDQGSWLKTRYLLAKTA